MNVHHLELFYHVARNRGITAAVRNMPYGIQQPAVSGQILQLEKSLGVTLFNRRPFALTPEGEELFRFINPFFSGLERVAERLSGEESWHLRLAASPVVLSGQLPELLRELKRVLPALRLTLRNASATEAEELVLSGAVDAAISIVPDRAASGVRVRELLRVPLELRVPRSLGVRSAKAFFARWAVGGMIEYPLVSLPPSEPISQLFRQGLNAAGLRWEPQVEVDALDLVAAYVEGGFGAGVSVAIPDVPRHGSAGRAAAEVETLPLHGFPPLRIGLLTTGTLKPLGQRFVAAVEERAREIAASWRDGAAGGDSSPKPGRAQRARRTS